jgi:hypothetical protein
MCEDELRRKRRGGALFSLCAYARFAQAKEISERIWNADRRSIQPAVLLARPRPQQEAHAYRRSTAVLTCGLSPAARDFRPGFLGRGKNADL